MDIDIESKSAFTREVYSVDGVRVTLDARQGWRCDCTPAPMQSLRCTHIERASVFKQMRGVKRHDDTVRPKFDTPELRALEHAASGASTIPHPGDHVRPSQRGVHLSRWAAVVIVVALAGVSSAVTYIAMSRAETAPVGELHTAKAIVAPVPPPHAEPRQVPVKFVNPFDPTEVFEFPPSTSQNAARAAVREHLLQRARARLASTHASKVIDEVADARDRCRPLSCSTPLIQTAAASN